MVIGRYRSSLYLGIFFTLLGIGLLSFTLYCDLQQIHISSDGSHKIFYAFAAYMIFVSAYEVHAYFVKRMVVCDEEIFIHRSRRRVITLSSRKDILRVEISRRRRFWYQMLPRGNVVRIYDKKNQAVFSEGTSDSDCDWLEEYFRTRAVLYVLPRQKE